MKNIHVCASGEYDVKIGTGILSQLGKEAASHQPLHALLVTDDNVNALYGDMTEKSLAEQGIFVSRLVLPHGEKTKSVNSLSLLLETAAEKQLTRRDMLVALGGGVVGDLTGFAASVYMRGIKFLQVPTTLLAAVDSSVGGKTAIDLMHGKNLAGSFWQPCEVLCDCDILRKLPQDIFSEGMAEVIKYGVISDPEIIKIATDGRAMAEIETLTEKCVAIKRDFVQEDEHDTGVRQLLNCGHTVGHAVERASGYTVSHGQAVAIGMVTEAKIAYALHLCEKSVVDAITDAVRTCGLPTNTEYSVQTLCDFMTLDKKNTGEGIVFILPDRLGHCSLHTLQKEQVMCLL